MKQSTMLKLLKRTNILICPQGNSQIRPISLSCKLQFERKPDVHRHLTWSYLHGPGPFPMIGNTICETLQSTVEQTPDRECMVFCESDTRRTFQQLMLEVDQLAAGLHNLGFRKGDRIGIWGPSTVEWVVTQFASARIGAILVNVNPAYQIRELEFALNKTKIKGIVAPVTFKTQKYYEMIAELAPEISECAPMELKSKRLPDLQTVIMMGSEKLPGALAFDDLMQVGTSKDIADVQNISRNLDFDDPINIQFTSGTTGHPKGATLSHHNVLNNIRYIGGRLGYGDYYHRILCQVPLYHCFGMVGGPLALAAYGVGIVFPCAGYDPGLTLKAMAEEKTDVVYGTPTMYIDMMSHPDAGKYDLSHLQKGIMAGSPCPAEVVQKFENTFAPIKLMNRIGDIQDFAFESLENLLILNLKNNRLPSLGDDMFTGLSSLKTLRLSSNIIEVISAASLFPLENLRRLYLDGNKLTSVPSKAFSGGVLLHLVELDLGRNKITHVTDKEFASLPGLNYMNLAKNQLSWLSYTAFDGMPKLKSLQLNQNKLSNIPKMPDFHRLKNIALEDNPWTCDCKMEVAYGTTENSPVTFMNYLDDTTENRTTTVGLPAPFTEAKIINEEGKVVPVNTPGELCIRGYCVMQGYWDSEDKTSECITQEGWYKTGDVATLDEQGYCRIVGRTKDMIIRGGENIYPAEIEDVIHGFEKVDNVQVFGVTDERLGEEVAAWISIRAGQTTTPEEIRAYCKGKMSHFKIPRYIKFVEEFPLTVTRKVQKFKMQEDYSKELGLTK